MKRTGIFLILTSIALVSSCGETSPSGGSSSGYTITLKNYNGSVLKVDTDVKEGTIPKYNGSTPTRPDDATYTYSWTGWTPTVVAAKSDATYTATFKATKKEAEKVTVPAHTLKDSNSPFDSDDDGEMVSENMERI